MYAKDLATTWGKTNIQNLFDVKGKVVLITGGGRGIGLMMAQGFVENGAKVIISSRNGEELKKAAQELANRGPGTCYDIQADLSKMSECKRLAEEVASRETHLDVLINNSGVVWGENYETYPESAFDKLYALNVKAVFFLTRACTPLLEKAAEKNGHASVISLGSIDGIRVSPLETYAYSATKSGVHHLTRHLANKLSSKKITVNAIAAGFFPTKMTAATFRDFGDALNQSILMGRGGNPADISGAVIYLSSKAGQWVTGSVLVVDGGSSIKANM